MPRTPWDLTPVLMQAAGLNRADARRQLTQLHKQYHMRTWRRELIEFMVLLFAAAGIGVILGVFAIESTVRIVPGFVVFGTVWIMLSLSFEFRKQHRRFLRHLNEPLCFRCGYQLTGLARLEHPCMIVCPECGNHSPAATQVDRQP
jgi:Flp pilus assembly protein TadB